MVRVCSRGTLCDVYIIGKESHNVGELDSPRFFVQLVWKDIAWQVARNVISFQLRRPKMSRRLHNPLQKENFCGRFANDFHKIPPTLYPPPPSHKYCAEYCVATVSGISQLSVSLMSRDPRRRAKWRETLPIVTLTHRTTFVWQRVNFFRNMTNREETKKKHSPL